MSFKKAFATQDAEMADLLALQRKSVAKLAALLDKMRQGDGPISQSDAAEFMQASQVLLNRCRRYQAVGQRMDFIGA
jgi:hypothetical protein